MSSATEPAARRPARLARALPLVIALAACAADRPPPETARSVGIAPSAALDRAAAALREQGFAVRREEGPAGAGLRGERSAGGTPDWAHCRVATVGRPFSDSGQTVSVRPGATATTLTVTAAPAGGGARVAVELRTVGIYDDPFRGARFEIPCASTGTLERAVLDAVGAPA